MSIYKVPLTRSKCFTINLDSRTKPKPCFKVKTLMIDFLTNFLVLPMQRCVFALYTQYFPEPCEQISQAYDSSGIRTHDPCNSRAVSYQLDYRGCPVARGSLSPMFWQRVPQRYKRWILLWPTVQWSKMLFDCQFELRPQWV